MRLDRLLVVGPGTDLEIGLMPKSRFTGGSAVSAKGIAFEFARGEVKSFSAGRGRQVIESFLGIDAEARRMGGGGPDALEGGESMSEEELKAAGCNVSLVYTDFMMGSPEV